jgi:4-aminobutyrate aminotransferase-like enzyme
VRGVGLYQMLDIVADRKSKKPDFGAAERIRFNGLSEGLLLLTSRNCIRLVPPLIISEAELDDAVGRLERALEKTQAGEPRGLDLLKAYNESSSLAHAQAAR